jgi:predicted nucleotidyltransferase
MKSITENDIASVAQAIVREVNPERVYLFGSRARGDAREGSDLDLLVVDGENFGPARSRIAEMGRLYRLLMQFRIPTDILLYSADEFHEWSGSLNHVIGRCVREGRLLYERS